MRIEGEISDAERYRGLPRDMMQEIARAAYEAKVCEMEDRARQKAAYDPKNPPKE